MFRKVKILLIETDAAQAVRVRERLEHIKLAFTLEVVEDATEFKNRLKANECDLALVVHTPGGIKCFALLAEMLREHGDIPFIVLSTVKGEELAVEFIKAGATDYVLSDRIEHLDVAVPRALRDAEEKQKRKLAETTILKVLQQRQDELLNQPKGEFLAGPDLNHLRLRVLILEDNQTDALLLKENLYEQGFTPVFHVVDNKNDFVEVLRSFKPEIILSDFSLPDFDGVEALAIRNRTCPDVPFIFVSGVMNSKFSAESLRAGATNYVAKDGLSELGQVVHRAMVQTHERELRRAAELQHRRVHAMAQREDFMATLTHDLKNPLVGFDGVFQALLRGSVGELNSEQRRLLNLCRDSNRELLSMIQHLLEVYRYEKDMEDITLHPVDFGGLVQSTIGVVSIALVSKKADVTCLIEDDVPPVMADAFSLTRAVQNLIENAIKYGPDGGRLRVTLRRDKSSVVLEVENDGAGIAPEDQTLLFDRFWQGSTGRKRLAGTGLGLYLCKRIVDAHNGSISCVSAPGKGAKFVVSLPVEPVYVN